MIFPFIWRLINKLIIIALKSRISYRNTDLWRARDERKKNDRRMSIDRRAQHFSLAPFVPHDGQELVSRKLHLLWHSTRVCVTKSTSKTSSVHCFWSKLCYQSSYSAHSLRCVCVLATFALFALNSSISFRCVRSISGRFVSSCRFLFYQSIPANDLWSSYSNEQWLIPVAVCRPKAFY